MKAKSGGNKRKIKKYLLVDGYNIIFDWNNLKGLAKQSLEHARDKLIHILSNYRGAKPFEIIVVFDAHNVSGGQGGIFVQDGISVVFTHEAETADQYIERTSKELAADYSVTVATSDTLEQIIIIGAGARRMSSAELYEDVSATEKLIRKQIDDIRPIKNNQLLDNLDADMAALLEKMRRG